MASDYYLHIEDVKIGTIKGEAVDAAFENDIQLLDFKFEVESPDAGGGSPKAIPRFHDVEFTAPSGGASASLLQILCDNGEIKVARVTCRKATGTSGMQKFMVWEFTTGRLTKFRQLPSENGRLLDYFSLRFAKVECTAWRQKKDGSLENGSRTGVHNLATNTR